MRNLLRVLLAVFTAAIRRTSDVDPITPQHTTLCQSGILDVRYISYFILIAQYQLHTPGTIHSMQDYRADFHKHKDVFLRFCGNKSTPTEAKEATRDLRTEHQELLVSETPLIQSSSKRGKVLEELCPETEEMQHDMLTSGANYNFPKMHLISHFPEQMRKYGSLPQYSTEICEDSHKSLKDAYRRSNHIDTMPQIIQTYTCDHTFAMRNKNLECKMTELKPILNDVQTVIHPTRASLHLPKGSPAHLLATRL